MVEQRVNSDRILLEIYDTSREVVRSVLTKKCLAPLLANMERLLWSDRIKVKKMGVRECQLTLHLCGEYKIRRLNQLYRNIDRVTDVLSFPVHEDLRKIESAAILEVGMPTLLLGDIFICRQVASRQAASFGISYQEELLHLFAHGVIHLIGFDHERSKVEEQNSQELEEQLLWKSR
jgi:probable rRNA maturation factor